MISPETLGTYQPRDADPSPETRNRSAQRSGTYTAQRRGTYQPKEAEHISPQKRNISAQRSRTYKPREAEHISPETRTPAQRRWTYQPREAKHISPQKQNISAHRSGTYQPREVEHISPEKRNISAHGTRTYLYMAKVIRNMEHKEVGTYELINLDMRNRNISSFTLDMRNTPLRVCNAANLNAN